MLIYFNDLGGTLATLATCFSDSPLAIRSDGPARGGEVCYIKRRAGALSRGVEGWFGFNRSMNAGERPQL